MLMSLIRVLAPLTILLLSSPVEAQNRNPNHRLTVAKENAVKQTSIGMDAAQTYEYRSNNALMTLGDTPAAFFTRLVGGKLELSFNSQLGAASFEYLSWIVMAGLVDYNLQAIVVQDFKTSLPRFIEQDLLVFSAAMEYYDEIGFSTQGDIDYANHPRFSYARDQMLSLTKFHDLWKSNKTAFYEYLVLRRKKLDGNVLSIESYLQRTNLTRSQRSAAEFLEQLFSQTLQ
tara:strand:- start:698 stop:1387 length:690 start_codon:yes stop_codon:yes gene_type:complete